VCFPDVRLDEEGSTNHPCDEPRLEDRARTILPGPRTPDPGPRGPGGPWQRVMTKTGGATGPSRFARWVRSTKVLLRGSVAGWARKRWTWTPWSASHPRRYKPWLIGAPQIFICPESEPAGSIADAERTGPENPDATQAICRIVGEP
jgi:hypothetical protein